MILGQAFERWQRCVFIRNETNPAKTKFVLQAVQTGSDFTAKTRARYEQYWKSACLPKG